MPLIDRYENIGTEAPTFYVNHTGQFIIRFSVIYSNSRGKKMRRTYEIPLTGAQLVKLEELKEELQP